MIFLYSSNHERMWHNLVLALTIEVCMTLKAGCWIHTFISEMEGESFRESWQKNVGGAWLVVTQGAVSKPRVGLFIRRLWAVCLLCRGRHLTRKKEMNGKIKKAGVSEHDTNAGRHTIHQRREATPSSFWMRLIVLWAGFEIFYGWVCSDIGMWSLTVWLCPQTTSSEAKTGVSLNSRGRCVSSLW